jgi:hypothetical protein
MESNDPHRLQPDHAPTPFTAAEIRAATRVGRTVETMTEEAGRVVARHRTTFVACDRDAATIRHVEIDADGNEVGEAGESSSSWHELQAHASFPADITRRTTEIVELPIGTLRCLRYEVARGEMTMTFWFATDLPGQPVRYAMHLEHGRDRITTVCRITQPA